MVTPSPKLPPQGGEGQKAKSPSAKEEKLKIVIGLGKTGLSCVRYLVQQNVSIAVMDSRTEPPELNEFRQEFPNIPLTLGKFDENIMQQADELIVSPGVSIHEPAIAKQIQAGIPVIGDIELFVRVAKAPIVAITGSNGKSTVTTLLGEMAKTAGLKVCVGGNLGQPVLDFLTEGSPDLYVLELSSFQLETTYSLQAASAVLLNLSEDHLDRYPGGMPEYLAAKQRIYRGCKTAIINRDELSCYEGLQFNSTLSFGLNEPSDHQFGVRRTPAGEYLAYGSQNLLLSEKLRIKGRHQLANALAALALGQAIHLPMNAMLHALENFTGLPHRCQWVATYNEIAWYNDSKGTNVGAAQAAIQGLGTDSTGKIILIAGGLGKGADFSVLGETVAKYVRAVVLIGKDAPIIEQALRPSQVPLINASSLQEAVSIAATQAQAGDAVLLSPACASYDMFQNFEHRGEVFMNLVQHLVSNKQSKVETQ
jgi:UDP-N-acetylmuramoylalanine--D-glutamate ligase